MRGEPRRGARVWREVWFLLILEFCFFFFFPRFCQFLSNRPSFLSLSPTGSPPPHFFLASAGTLSPTSLSFSFSVFLTFSRRPRSPFSPHSLPLSPSSVHSSDTRFFFFNPKLFASEYRRAFKKGSRSRVLKNTAGEQKKTVYRKRTSGLWHAI